MGLGACLEVLAGERSYSYTSEPKIDSLPPGNLVLFHRARSFGRDAHGAVKSFQLVVVEGKMSKVVLYYFDGRGQMESIRWLLAVAGVEFEEVLLKTREQFEKLLKDGSLMFQQVPLVEMDGMKLVQSKAILNYIAGKYNLYGKDLQERVRIDMYSEGTRDLMDMMKMLPFVSPDEKTTKLELIQSKSLERYFPVYENALSGSQYLVGNQLSCADVHLLEATLMVEEKFPAILSSFPNLQAFQARMKKIPTISKFLQPGSKRKPQPDEIYVKTVKEVLRF